MKCNCLIVDDEYLAIRILEDYCSRIPGLTVLQSFKDPVAASQFLRDHPVDLLFLDIQMPRLSGIEIVSALPEKEGARPRVVFSTASPEFAVQAFEWEALDYLVKPISFQRFEKTIRKIEDPADTPDKKIVTLAALKDLEGRLPESQFVRIHKSYILSLAHIRWWSASEVEITGGTRLPIGRVYKENFLGRLPK